MGTVNSPDVLGRLGERAGPKEQAFAIKGINFVAAVRRVTSQRA
jgi:hypothetical protein